MEASIQKKIYSKDNKLKSYFGNFIAFFTWNPENNTKKDEREMKRIYCDEGQVIINVFAFCRNNTFQQK